MSVKASWDIFCVVVDNYGDIGVTWRLARQLVAEYGQRVRLWVDDLETFARLCPGASAEVAQQWQQGVEIRHWSQPWCAAEPADVVIEAFACNLPQPYINAMAASGRGSGIVGYNVHAVVEAEHHWRPVADARGAAFHHR